MILAAEGLDLGFWGVILGGLAILGGILLKGFTSRSAEKRKRKAEEIKRKTEEDVVTIHDQIEDDIARREVERRTRHEYDEARDGLRVKLERAPSRKEVVAEIRRRKGKE